MTPADRRVVAALRSFTEVVAIYVAAPHAKHGRYRIDVRPWPPRHRALPPLIAALTRLDQPGAPVTFWIVSADDVSVAARHPVESCLFDRVREAS